MFQSLGDEMHQYLPPEVSTEACLDGEISTLGKEKSRREMKSKQNVGLKCKSHSHIISP